MILTPLIDINSLNLSIFWTFMVIDDKGGEIVYKDSEKTTKGRIWHRGRDMTKEMDQLKFLSTQVGGASSWTCMVHLNVHFLCLFAWHKF